MSDKPSVRINKVLRELNISLDRVAEFLLKKKIKIDIRPTTKITNEVYQILLDEFEGDKSDRVASDEISEVKRKEKEEKENLRISLEENDQSQKNKFIEKENINIFRSPINKPKMVGKIDLDKKENFENKSLKKEEPKNIESIVEPKKNQEQPKDQDSKLKDQIENPKNDETVKTNYQKLSGPIKTGEKLNIDEINKKEKNIEEARKRKRKRISKDPRKKETISEKKYFQKSL
tara:strand:- start:690 stop:1388 length:699 start_codon:yes stop_codon:yes gene_type:complete